MTTSGFLSPLKGQGKMPDARAPPKMPVYPPPPPSESEEGEGVEGRQAIEPSGGDSRSLLSPVSGVAPSPKVKKNLSTFSKNPTKGSTKSPARGKSPGKSKSPKGGENGSKLKELLVTSDSALDLTASDTRGEEYREMSSSPEHELVIADDEDPETRRHRLMSYVDSIDLVVRASKEAVRAEEGGEDRGRSASASERQREIERLEQEKMQWFREQEQQIKQDIEAALLAKKQLELERQQRESSSQISEQEREAHVDDTIDGVVASATAAARQEEDEESRREKDVYEFDDDGDFGGAPRNSVALHSKPGEIGAVGDVEKNPTDDAMDEAEVVASEKDVAKDVSVLKDVSASKDVSVSKDVSASKDVSVSKDGSASKDAKKSKSKKVKIKTEPDTGKESEDTVDVKEKLKQKLHNVSLPGSPGRDDDEQTFAVAAKPSPTIEASSARSKDLPSDSVASPGGSAGKEMFVAIPPIRIEKTTLTIKVSHQHVSSCNIR